MKRIISLSIILLCFSISLLGCTSMDGKAKISDHSWEIESVSDLEGNPLNKEMTLDFHKDSSFVLLDKSNEKEWLGQYALEKIDDSYKLDLDFEEIEETIVGVYGTRDYEDKRALASITFEFQDEIISFIAEE